MALCLSVSRRVCIEISFFKFTLKKLTPTGLSWALLASPRCQPDRNGFGIGNAQGLGGHGDRTPDTGTTRLDLGGQVIDLTTVFFGYVRISRTDNLVAHAMADQAAIFLQQGNSLLGIRFARISPRGRCLGLRLGG